MQHPSLRPCLAAEPDPNNTDRFLVWDTLGLTDHVCRFSAAELQCLRLFDGHRSLTDIQFEANQNGNGHRMTSSSVQALARKLAEAEFLDGPAFRELVDNPIREPRCIGCYTGEPATLRHELHDMFTGPNASGLPEPRPQPKTDRLCAVYVPHIDYPRGGATYTWGFKELVEQTDASLFVIIGTSHFSAHRFTLTRKDFKTPLGIVPTDQDYIDQLVEHFGHGLFDDEWQAHLPEHSIELEVVLLQYLYEDVKSIRIVPLVVGSFHDCVTARQTPCKKSDIGKMVQALQEVEKVTDEPICYIISGDLAHIGPKFGDDQPAHGSILTDSRQQDHTILAAAEIADADRLFDVIADKDDSRRICGLPPAYVTLAATRPVRGQLLAYDQYVHPLGYESVSFASLAFYQ